MALPPYWEALLFCSEKRRKHIMSEHPVTSPTSETTRVFAFLTQEQLIEARDAYVREIGKAPRIEVRGSVEFVEPGKRANTWRKKREVDLSDWYEVRDWKRNEPLLLIWYKFNDQWVRATSLFDRQWFDVRLAPTFADEKTAYLTRQRKREDGADGSDDSFCTSAGEEG
jgi:hypothetical protein